MSKGTADEVGVAQEDREIGRGGEGEEEGASRLAYK